MDTNEDSQVAGSNPAARTRKPQENEASSVPDTALTRETPESQGENVRFPKRIKYRGKVLAVIYGKTKNYGYRVAWHVAGQRRMQRFKTYAEAKQHADTLAKDLAKGGQSSALTPTQARDALAALQCLETYRQRTGRQVSLLSGISEYCESMNKLHGRTLGEAVDGYLSSVASVHHKDLAEAVEEFIKGEQPRTVSTDGHRAQLSTKYAENKALVLRRFAGTFKNTAVADLGKHHLDLFIGSLKNTFGVETPKSRNHYRGAVLNFLGWCVRKDYLSPTNRLAEADGMQTELANTAEVEFYTPKEFRTLLEAAEGPMQALLAIGGLCGLRTAELLRITWEDAWRVPGYIEVTASKSKTRQRRLVEAGPALAAWLESFRSFTTGRIWDNTESVFQKAALALAEQAGVQRKDNALRHSFCTYHFALHANENLTAAQAGNSPAMIHSNYKGLATKKEAEAWFTVSPAKAENVVPISLIAETK